MNRISRSLAVAALLTLTAASAVPAAAAGPAPVNDSISAPTVIGALPFSTSLDTTGATNESIDPGWCFAPEYGTDTNTVWLSWTAAASGPIGAATWGSDYDTTIYVGTSNGAGGIDVLACDDDTRSVQAAVRFDAVAGETYVFMVGASVFGGTGAGELVFTLDVGPAAQEAHVTIDPIGQFDGGDVVFHGSVSCAAEADLSSLLVVELRQFTNGRESAAATGFADIAGCPGSEIPFEIVVPRQDRVVHPGVAEVQVIYAACNDFECANETKDFTATIAP